MKDSPNRASAITMIGALIVDKPAGLTSHDVVARVRRVTGVRRVGHAGTLDPFATGVLVCCIGRATRLVRFLADLEKEYIATVRLGFATDTQDLTGKQMTPTRSSNELSLEELRSTLSEFAGPQLQTPPMFSAKKIGGERLYRAARQGREIAREPVSIVIHAIELIEDQETTMTRHDDGTLSFRMRVRCSSGTYVRTLAHDVGERLGLGGHLIDLQRTAVGQFRLGDSLTLDEVESMSPDEVQLQLIAPAAMLSHLPMLHLDAGQVRRVANGQSLELSENATRTMVAGSFIRLCDSSGKLAGVAKCDPLSSLVTPVVVLEANTV